MIQSSDVMPIALSDVAPPVTITFGSSDVPPYVVHEAIDHQDLSLCVGDYNEVNLVGDTPFHHLYRNNHTLSSDDAEFICDCHDKIKGHLQDPSFNAGHLGENVLHLAFKIDIISQSVVLPDYLRQIFDLPPARLEQMVNVRSDDGSTPLHIAIESGYKDAVEELIKLNYVNYNLEDSVRNTPLMLAARLYENARRLGSNVQRRQEILLLVASKSQLSEADKNRLRQETVALLYS